MSRSPGGKPRFNSNNNSFYGNKQQQQQRPKLDVHANINTMIAKINALKFRKFQVKLYVDHREREFICGLFKQLRADLVVFANLPMGDFLIVVNNKILYAFERKRLDDLCASIREKGKRMESQKLNMIELSGLTDTRRAVFLFEKLEPSATTNHMMNTTTSSSSYGTTATSTGMNSLIIRSPNKYGPYIPSSAVVIQATTNIAFDWDSRFRSQQEMIVLSEESRLHCDELPYEKQMERVACISGQSPTFEQLCANQWMVVLACGSYRGQVFTMALSRAPGIEHLVINVGGSYWTDNPVELVELKAALLHELHHGMAPLKPAAAAQKLDEAVLFHRWQREGLMSYSNEKDPLMNLTLGRDAIDGATVKRHIRDRMAVLFSEGPAHTVHLLLKWLQFTHEFGETYLQELELQPELTLDKTEFEHRALTLQGQMDFLRSRRQTMLETKEEERLQALQFTDSQRLLIRQMCVIQGVTVDPAVRIVQHLQLTSPKAWSKYLSKHSVDDIVQELSLLPASDAPPPSTITMETKEVENEQDDDDGDDSPPSSPGVRHIGPALILKLYNLYCDTDYEICGTSKKRPRILKHADAVTFRENLTTKRTEAKRKRELKDQEEDVVEQEPEDEVMIVEPKKSIKKRKKAVVVADTASTTDV